MDKCDYCGAPDEVLPDMRHKDKRICRYCQTATLHEGVSEASIAYSSYLRNMGHPVADARKH
jgi:predicted nucleic acid-binding Zn ribbon protein